MLSSSVDFAFPFVCIMKTKFFTYRRKHEKQKKMELEKHEKAIKFEAKKENEKRSKKEELLWGAMRLGLLKTLQARGAMHLGLLKTLRARPTYARSYYIILI